MSKQNQSQNKKWCKYYNQYYFNSKFTKIIQYTIENYFNTKIINFPNKINQQDKSFYISFNIEQCSCERKTHKSEFCIIFTIKEKVDLNTVFELNKIKLIKKFNFEGNKFR